MKLESKYEIGQLVFGVRRDSVEAPSDPCSACDATGQVDLRGQTFTCPSCKGSKALKRTGYGWVRAQSGTVGMIRIAVIKDPKDSDIWDVYGDWGADDPCPHSGGPLAQFEYILDSTGVGSGWIWKERDLFSSAEEAQAECDRRNGYSR